jgi:hypothetical protein
VSLIITGLLLAKVARVSLVSEVNNAAIVNHDLSPAILCFLLVKVARVSGVSGISRVGIIGIVI